MRIRHRPRLALGPPFEFVGDSQLSILQLLLGQFVVQLDSTEKRLA